MFGSYLEYDLIPFVRYFKTSFLIDLAKGIELELNYTPSRYDAKKRQYLSQLNKEIDNRPNFS